jgi:hypothetical protein
MTNNPIWKLWLYANLLTSDEHNDYIAEVSTVGNTLRNEDVARQIVKERSELRYETILSILNERDAVVRDALLGGSSVQDGNVHLAPRVTGSWEGTTPLFDRKVHKITFDAVATAEMRAALDSVHVEILGIKTDGGARIGLVTDTLTGKTDGTISTYGTIIVDGEKIKIDPLEEPGLGVFFVAAGGAETPALWKLTLNQPKRIICTVPPLDPGDYTLKIITRYSHGGKLLKHPRTIVYDMPLTVKDNAARQDGEGQS